jgi:hypothetical protein
MAYPAGTETGASLDAWIPEIWGEKVNEFYRAKLVAAPFFTDRSDELSGGGDTLYTPATTEFTATAKSVGIAVNLNSPTDTKVTLDSAIVALFAGFSKVVGSSTTNLQDSDIRSAFAYLDAANADSEEAAFFFHPTVFWRQVQRIDKFALAVNSPNQNPTMKRPAGFLYGTPVYITTQIINTLPTGGLARMNAIRSLLPTLYVNGRC